MANQKKNTPHFCCATNFVDGEKTWTRWSRRKARPAQLWRHARHCFNFTAYHNSSVSVLSSVSRYDLIPGGPWPGIGGTNKFGGSEGYSKYSSFMFKLQIRQPRLPRLQNVQWQMGLSKNIGISKYSSYFVPDCIFLTDTPTQTQLVLKNYSL